MSGTVGLEDLGTESVVMTSVVRVRRRSVVCVCLHVHLTLTASTFSCASNDTLENKEFAGYFIYPVTFSRTKSMS